MIPGAASPLLQSGTAAGGGDLGATNLGAIGNSSGGACTVTLTIKTDGSFQRGYSGTGASLLISSGPSNWYTPTTGAIGSSYQVRFTPDGASVGANGGSLVDNTWTTISANKTVYRSAFGSCSGLLEFRRLSDSVVVATSSISLDAESGL